MLFVSLMAKDHSCIGGSIYSRLILKFQISNWNQRGRAQPLLAFGIPLAAYLSGTVYRPHARFVPDLPDHTLTRVAMPLCG